MKKILFMALCAILLCSTACYAADNDVDTITRQLTFKQQFSKIRAYSGVRVKYSVLPDGQTPTAKLVVNKQVADSFTLTVKDGTLLFGYEHLEVYNNSINSLSDIWKLIRGKLSDEKLDKFFAVLYLSAPAVESISASSSAVVKVLNEFTTTANLTLSSSSGAEIKLPAVECCNLTAKTSSGAELSIEALKAESVSIASSSGSDAEIDNIIGAKNVAAKASSGAEIKLRGTATNAELSASSGADVAARKLRVKHAKLKASSGGTATIYADTISQHQSSAGTTKNYKNSNPKSLQSTNCF
ncbi:MAG: DUF2807 domain-containing protein [Muribaculum sp.]|nr:DUF2807 domain-containing protein [Muribaculaceae bacterium]MCM1080769.1 DUF2807 domain-containing protein [Muribaculum sp.]